jgi:hypothetical protein
MLEQLPVVDDFKMQTSVKEWDACSIPARARHGRALKDDYQLFRDNERAAEIVPLWRVSTDFAINGKCRVHAGFGIVDQQRLITVQ